MPWIAVGGGGVRWDDKDECEWVDVYSSTGLPGKIQNAVKQLCGCVCVHMCAVAW